MGSWQIKVLGKILPPLIIKEITVQFFLICLFNNALKVFSVKMTAMKTRIFKLYWDYKLA